MTTKRTPTLQGRTALVAYRWTYEAMRTAMSAESLGRVDWLLWGKNHNPFKEKTRRHTSYNKGYAAEKSATPNPIGTRINPRGPRHETHPL